LLLYSSMLVGCAACVAWSREHSPVAQLKWVYYAVARVHATCFSLTSCTVCHYREIVRAGVQEAYQLGPVFTALRELTLFQHLHYFYSPCPAATTEGAVTGECPLFVAPVGVVTLTAGEFGRSPALRRALLGDDAATTANGHDLQYLAFPAVHLSLARVLGLSTPASSSRWEVTRSHLTNGSGEGSAQAVLQLLQGNKGHLLPATFAVDLVRDLFSAVAHMITWYGRRPVLFFRHLHDLTLVVLCVTVECICAG
jgi:hypothetical protein